MTKPTEKAIVYSQHGTPMPYPFKSEERRTLGSDFGGNATSAARMASASKPRSTS